MCKKDHLSGWPFFEMECHENFLFVMVDAAGSATATTVVRTATAAVGTANAFFAALFGFVYIENCAADQ